jgi:hypothetical protein
MRRTSPRVPARLWPVCIHAVPFCVAGVLHLFADASTVFLAGGATATCTYAYLIRRECWGKRIVLTPLTCFLFWFGLVLGPTSVYVALRFSEDQALAFLIWLVPLQAVATGYVLTLLGACSMHLGMILGLPDGRERAAPRKSFEGSALTIPTLFACVSVTVFFGLYAKSLLFIGSTIGYLLAGIGPAAACIYASSRRCGFRQEWAKVFVLLPITALMAIAVGGAGSKLAIFSAAIPTLWFFLGERKRRKYALAIGPLIAVVFVFVVAPAVDRARLARGSANVTAADILDTRRELADELRRDPQDYLLRSVDYAALRLFIEPVAVGYIANRVSTEGYTYGGELVYLTWAVIPRVLWKDKPFVTRGEWFTSEIGFSMNEEASTTSTGMTSPGELYWNFGWAGVAIGMSLLGYLISRLLWRLALPDPRVSLIVMLPYAHVLCNFMLYQDSEFGSSVLGIVQAYLLFFVIAKLARSVRLTPRSPYFSLRYSSGIGRTSAFGGA